MTNSYVMDNAWQGERQRLAALEARGIGSGWRCWEVDAGGESPLNPPQVRAALLATGKVGENDIGQFLTQRRDPSFTSMSNLLIAAWGRRPLA